MRYVAPTLVFNGERLRLTLPPSDSQIRSWILMNNNVTFEDSRDGVTYYFHKRHLQFLRFTMRKRFGDLFRDHTADFDDNTMPESEADKWENVWSTWVSNNQKTKRQKKKRKTTKVEIDESAYAVLFVMPDAPDIVVKAAWRALSQKYHSDTGGENADDGKFDEVQQAYKTIMGERGE